MSTWNGNKFSVYASDEKQVLGLIEELGDQTNSNTDLIEKVITTLDKVLVDVLPENVETVLNQWYASGQFETLINSELIGISKIHRNPLISDDSITINNAISNGGIFILDDIFTINNPIRIKDNTTIKFSKNAKITLASNSNCYIFRNDDFINGNKNIEIDLFDIDGNGDLQARNLSLGAANGYGGYGMMFYLVDGLKIHDGKVSNTNSWAIAHFSCTNFEFKRIKIEQLEDFQKNTDGITGTSSNGIIEDISGLTGDDMIALSCFSGGLGGGWNNGLGGENLLPNTSVKNVVIRNIFPRNNTNGMTTPHGIALYSSLNLPMQNITIENVKGYTHDGLINVANFWTDKPNGIYNDLKIRDCEEYFDQYTNDHYTIRIGIGNYDNLSLSNIKRKSTSSNIYGIVIIMSDANIKNLFLDQLDFVNNNLTGGCTAVLIDSTTANVKNIFAKDSTISGSANNILIQKVGVNPYLTTVHGSNLKSNYLTIWADTLAANLTANAPDCIAYVASLVPVNGNIVLDHNTKLPVGVSYGYFDDRKINITLTNSWQAWTELDFKAPSIYKKSNRAYLSGMARLGGIGDGSVIGTIPVDLAPNYNCIFTVATNEGAKLIKLKTNGEITVGTGGFVTNTFISFDGVSFPIKDSII